MLRVLTLSTLFPDATRPHFGPFVELQTLGLAAHPDVELRAMIPVGIPPLGRFYPRYKALAALPEVETWKGLPVYRTRFAHIPGTNGRFDAQAMTRALIRPLKGIREQFPFDVIDAEFFFPDGPAAIALGRAFGVPVSIKARGADIHHWGMANAATRAQVIAAGRAADGMLAVSAALKADMVALGMPEERITVHYTGIDRTRFYVRDRAAAKAALGLSGPLLVSVGNLIERKGHAITIEALRAVPDATLVIIGGGAERAALEALAARMGVAERVRFLGSQPHDAIAGWLAAADAMVLISASEGLANGWIEALASGTPIVIADVGGAREVVGPRRGHAISPLLFRGGAGGGALTRTQSPFSSPHPNPSPEGEGLREAGALTARDPASVAEAIRWVLARDLDRNAVAATVARFSWEANTAGLYAHLRGLVSG